VTPGRPQDIAAVPDELLTYAWLLARSGHLDAAAMTAEVAQAAREDHGVDELVAPRLVQQAQARVRAESATWPARTDHDRLEAVFAELRERDVLVLQHVDDHWTAATELSRRADQGHPAAGVVWFTAPDVWHAVQHGMLELNLWHGTGANAAPGDTLLDEVIDVLYRHALPAHYDEGRVEVACSWQRRQG
jgi:hypothetical protein